MATARGPRGRGTSWQIPHRNFPLPRPPRPDTPQGAHHCPCNGDPRSCLAHPFWPAPPRHPEPPAGPCPRPPPAGPQCAPQPARSRRPWAGAGRRNQDFQAPLGPATSPGPVSTLSSWHRPGTRARPAGDGPCARTGERWQQLGRGAALGGGRPGAGPAPLLPAAQGRAGLSLRGLAPGRFPRAQATLPARREEDRRGSLVSGRWRPSRTRARSGSRDAGAVASTCCSAPGSQAQATQGAVRHRGVCPQTRGPIPPTPSYRQQRREG